MKTIRLWITGGIMAMAISPTTSYAEGEVSEPNVYASLRAQMQRACPAQWEDLGAELDTSNSQLDIWQGNNADRSEFIALFQEVSASSGIDIDFESAADDLATVATECASYRVALLDALISKTPRELLLAMDTVNKGLNKSVEYLDGGWSVGDVRVTGRMSPQDGWVFLAGQTIGNSNSTAQMRGEDYNELYELAKNWAPNAGTEVWEAGHTVTLPDMRGRTLFGADNMGGESAGVLTAPEADNVGGIFGSEEHVLSEQNLPSHSHTMDVAGNHGHTLGYGGSHKHKLPSVRQYVYVNPTGSSSSWRAPWLRSGADMSTTSAGHHNHTVSESGSHQHQINSTGEGQAVRSLPPAITFNVEMKY